MQLCPLVHFHSRHIVQTTCIVLSICHPFEDPWNGCLVPHTVHSVILQLQNHQPKQSGPEQTARPARGAQSCTQLRCQVNAKFIILNMLISAPLLITSQDRHATHTTMRQLANSAAKLPLHQGPPVLQIRSNPSNHLPLRSLLYAPMYIPCMRAAPMRIPQDVLRRLTETHLKLLCQPHAGKAPAVPRPNTSRRCAHALCAP